VYHLRLLDAAERELARLDKPIARRVIERLSWLANHIDDIEPEALTGELDGLFKLRIGDFRVIYEILHSERLIIVHAIGHRREIYRDR